MLAPNPTFMKNITPYNANPHVMHGKINCTPFFFRKSTIPKFIDDKQKKPAMVMNNGRWKE